MYPGLLSGLVCAGANNPRRSLVPFSLDVGAGVLTAEEVAGLDLSGCRLAVLSACRTGLGNVAGGQGVLGLQRAFHRAGVATVVASLWDVDDVTTALLMDQFYANLWEKKLPILEALRQRSSRCWITPNGYCRVSRNCWLRTAVAWIEDRCRCRLRASRGAGVPRHGGPGLCSAGIPTDQRREKEECYSSSKSERDEPGFEVAARIGLAGSMTSQQTAPAR